MHRLKGSKKETCKQFLMLVDYSLDEKTAINLLKEVGWDMNNAMDYYFRNQHKLAGSNQASQSRNAVKDIFKKYRKF